MVAQKAQKKKSTGKVATSPSKSAGRHKNVENPTNKSPKKDSEEGLKASNERQSEPPVSETSTSPIALEVSRKSAFAVLLGLLGVVLVIYAVFTGFPSVEEVSGNYTFPQLTENATVCAETYICFKDEEGVWQRPAYNAGANLTIANMFPVTDEEKIADFFEFETLNIVVSSVEGQDSRNSEMILATTPFSYYMGHYFISFLGETKEITPYLLGEYNLTEPAIYIYGPGELGANETSLKYDGSNIIAQGESFEELRIVLGKLLLIAVKG